MPPAAADAPRSQKVREGHGCVRNRRSSVRRAQLVRRDSLQHNTHSYNAINRTWPGRLEIQTALHGAENQDMPHKRNNQRTPGHDPWFPRGHQGPPAMLCPSPEW